MIALYQSESATGVTGRGLSDRFRAFRGAETTDKSASRLVCAVDYLRVHTRTQSTCIEGWRAV